MTDPTSPVEVGRYDTLDESLLEPEDPEGDPPNPVVFDGAWGVWPFGPHQAIGDMRRGLILADHFPVVVEREEIQQ